MSTTDRIPLLYRYRTAVLWGAAITPLLAAGALYWVVTAVVLAPPVPDEGTDAQALARFVIHDRGLPRLSGARAQAVLHEQAARLAADATLRERFLATVRTATPDEQTAFRKHLLGVFKPLLMSHVEAFFAHAPAEREGYLDRRIVEYNRLSAALGKTELNTDALKALAPSKAELLAWVTGNTTAEEREQAAAYGAALTARVQAILADAELTAEFERRIAATGE